MFEFMLECHLLMLLTAVFFFSPIAWLAAVLSKRDCEMACDERTINRMGIAKEEYGKILLDLTVERLNTDVLFCHAVMISPSSYGLKARIRNVLSKQRNKKGQILMGILVVLFCAGTCFYEIPFLHNMNQEETIRQYVFYCNQEYFLGLKKICVPEKMDYFFHPKVTGKIVSLNKTSENSEEVLYQVVTEDKKGCKRKQSICLVQREQWKVKPWSEANVPFQYDVVKNKIRIKAYIGKEDVVSVPEKIEGKTVNEIQTGAFKNCNVKKITIPASIETIGSMAFFNLPDCEEITIGNKMALKSDDIFKRCPKLKEVNTKGKGTIVLQVLMEGLLIGAIAFVLATFSAPFVSKQVADYLVGYQLQEELERNQAEEGMVAKSVTETESSVVGVSVNIGTEVVFFTAISTMGMIVVSVLGSGIYIASQKPKDILSKMS